MRRALGLASLAFLLLPALAPAAERVRSVQPGGPGPQRLDPDPALLSASARGDLSDLRLVDGAGREVPWLLVPPAEPEGRWVGGAILPVRATKNESGFEVDLGRARPIARLRLGGLPEPFLKRFRLEGSGDRARWTVLVDEGTLFALPDERLRLLEAGFRPGEFRYLRWTWDDRASARLPRPRTAEAFAPAPPFTPAPALRVPLAIASRDSEPGVSRWALRLPGPRLPVRAIALDVGGGHVLRRASVLEAHLGPGRLEPVTLGAAELRRVVRGGVAAAILEIPTAAPEETELELRVEDGDNPPLDVRGATAVLAPLPWIFFESRDGAPIEARIGDPVRRAPRYDLEAVRAELPRLRTAEARLGPDTPAPEAAPPPPEPPDLAAGGELDRRPFRRARAIPAAPPGLSAIKLDAHVLAGSHGLADLRIAGPGGRQIPYLLEQREEPLVVPLPLAPAGGTRLARPGVSIHAVDLPVAPLPESRIVLETPSRLFERDVRVYAAEGGGPDRAAPWLLASASWRHADPARAAPSLVVRLPWVDHRRLLVVVEDGDNAPLPVAGARLLLPAWRLRFFHPGPALELLYGAARMDAPRYDLALLAPRLRTAPAREIELGPPAAGPAAAERDAATTGRIVFIAVLAAVVVALLALLARLLGRPDEAARTPTDPE